MEIKTVNLTKVMGSNFSLQPLNLDIKGPGLIGCLGPNGAGKTTTLKLFTNLLFPSGGEVFIDGINVHADPVSAMKNVSALIEDPEPYNYYSVKEFLNFVGSIKGLNKSDIVEQINKFTEMFHIDNPNMRIKKLSKGNKRKVMICAVLMGNNDIILLDEPSDGLDPIESKVFRDILNELKKTRLILMSPHLMYEVSETCDRIILLNRGKVIANDTTSEVIKMMGGARIGPNELENAFFKYMGSDLQ